MTIARKARSNLSQIDGGHARIVKLRCDILMPRLDGYQTCAIIKRNAKYSGVPVVMLSSKDGVFDKARGRMVGAQDYLTKPFTKDQLLQAVRQFGAVMQGAN